MNAQRIRMPAHADYIRGNCLAPRPQFAAGRSARETLAAEPLDR
jgi:hypothetical protein